MWEHVTEKEGSTWGHREGGEYARRQQKRGVCEEAEKEGSENLREKCFRWVGHIKSYRGRGSKNESGREARDVSVGLKVHIDSFQVFTQPKQTFTFF